MTPQACTYPRAPARPLSAALFALAIGLIPLWSVPNSVRAAPSKPPSTTAPAQTATRDVPPREGPRWLERYGFPYLGLGPYPGMEWVYYTDPDRDLIAFPETFLKLLDLKPGQTVADVGSGTGYFTFRAARAVGPKGGVFALEVETHGEGNPYHATMMRYFRRQLSDRTVNPYDNIQAIQSRYDDATLEPASVDRVLMYQVSCLLRDRDVLQKKKNPTLLKLHDKQIAMVKSVYRALKPGGKLVVVDLLDDPDLPGARFLLWRWKLTPYTLHMAAQQAVVERNYEALGFRLLRQDDMYMNAAYTRARAAFVETPWHREMVAFGIGHRMFVLVFEKPQD